MARGDATAARRSSFAFIMAVVFGLAGLVIAPGGCQKIDSAMSLKDRVSRYWELKQSKGWDEVYDKYLDPTVQTKLAKKAFLRKRRLAFDILSYEINDIKEEADTATVAVSNEVNFPLKSPAGELQLIKKRVTTTDQWVRREGTWYVVLTE